MNRAVVTGSQGFIGRRLTAQLRHEGWDVLGIGTKPGPSVNPDGSRYRHCRHTDLGSLLPRDWSNLPFTLIDLAWDTSRSPQLHPHLLHLARLGALLDTWNGRGLAAVVGVGSAEEYGPRGGLLREDDIASGVSWRRQSNAPSPRPSPPQRGGGGSAVLLPLPRFGGEGRGEGVVDSIPLETTSSHLTPYGWAKQAAGTMLRSWCERNGMPGYWMRPFLVYGPGQTGNMVIPYALEQAQRGEAARFSDGLQQRDFVFVDDAKLSDALTKPRREARFSGVRDH